MPKSQQPAHPGDIFILLVPTGSDRDRLNRQSEEFQQQYGGLIVDPIHITVERFSPTGGDLPNECVQKIQAALQGIKPFQIHSDAMIQFFAPYWQSPVLRWRVAATAQWDNFRSQLKSILLGANCPSHFTRPRHASCTILKLENKIVLPSNASNYARPLFTVQDIWISQLKTGDKFEIIEKIKIGK